jgi:hypothetical protein
MWGGEKKGGKKIITQKRSDFEIFKLIVELLDRDEHKTIEGLTKIVSLKASLNRGLSSKLKEDFCDIIPFVRPFVSGQEIPDPNWLVGFASGEGCFIAKLQKSSKLRLGIAITLNFNISQHSRDFELINSFIKYLDCGRIQKRKDKEAIAFEVNKFEDIKSKIIPFFQKYPLQGIKVLNFEDFCKILCQKISGIKSPFNWGRYR